MAINYGSCKICDEGMQLRSRSLNLDWNFVCKTGHYYTTVSEQFQSLEETYFYGKYCIKIWFFENKPIEYGLYFPHIEGVGSQKCVPANKIKFDPKNPHNILNKLKMIVVFS